MNHNLQNLSKIIQNEIDKGAISGSAIRVIHNNETVYEDEMGYANIEKGKLIGKDTIYRLFSMSKPITAVAVMILYERGLINLLAPVSDYLQGFHNQKVITEQGMVDVNRPVTVQDLLNMTAGVVYPDESFKNNVVILINH
jgi:CubicO group peptidase (beta-lactamase class C family)